MIARDSLVVADIGRDTYLVSLPLILRPCSEENWVKETEELSCGQMRPKSSSLASTQLAVFGGGDLLPMTPRTPSPLSNMEVKTYALGVFFW